MRITIVGCGKVGVTLARQLKSEEHEITIIDKNERVVDQISNTLDAICYVGNGASYEALKTANVDDECDLLIAVTATDEVNLLCCLVAHKLGAKHTVARVRNPEYDDQLYLLKDDLGLSMSINPERAVAEEIARILRFPSATHVEMFAHGSVELVSLRVPKFSVLDNLQLSDLPARLGVRVLICAVDRKGDVTIPTGEFTLKADDHIYLTGSPLEVEKAFKKARLLVNPVRNVMIAGGGRIAYYLTQELLKQRKDVKIIEQNKVNADNMAMMLPNAVVLHGDVADIEMLQEEGIEKQDAFISLIGLDEGNILSALFALQKNVPKVIAKVNNEHLDTLVKNSGLETTISPKQVIANIILRYVRSLSTRKPAGDVLALYKIVGGRAEVLEFKADESMENIIDITLKDLPIKKNIIIASLVRNGKNIIPRGNDKIQAGDGVLVVTIDQRLNELSDILED